MAPVSRKYRAAKLIVFCIGIVFNLALVSFPNLIPKEIGDRVLISFIAFWAVGLTFALEEVRLILHEHHEEAITNFKRIDDYILVNKIYRHIRKIEETGDEVFYQLARYALVQFEGRLRR